MPDFQVEYVFLFIDFKLKRARQLSCCVPLVNLDWHLMGKNEWSSSKAPWIKGNSILQEAEKESVIVKFKCRKLKWSILVNRKNPRNKSEDLHQLRFSGRLFISECMSMCHENHQLAYRPFRSFPKGLCNVLLPPLWEDRNKIPAS